ncbi:hypothetical protein BN14_05578 [Rhizoctonia solani AG-1 IB]|uniref:C3H1-type domain-containing protein n=1 Tax=Thanatephorus cucumeris (strain AG1-IB / isolate 7/3/14) TaxID=1108050 RepID=M5BV03_THACB|nr:hypothetical protein BN14_05578 [Rhizoctonia solani AG-1 IB]
MSASADLQPQPSASTSATISDSLTSEPTAPGPTSGFGTRPPSATHIERDTGLERINGTVSQANPSPNGPQRDSMPRATPTAMEIDTNEDPEIMEPSSSRASCIPASYHNLPENHYFVAPPVALPYPRSPVRRFPEGHLLHTQPSLFGYLPRAPPRSPRLNPLEILELESARERNEWEQVRQDLGNSRTERSSSTIIAPSSQSYPVPEPLQPHTNSQAPPSDDEYDSDSSDVELRIYNADPVDGAQTPSQPNLAASTVPPTPLGARPPVPQPHTVTNAFSAHRSIIQRLSQGPSTPLQLGASAGPSEAGVRRDSSPQSNNTTPAKRKFTDVDQNAQGSNIQGNSPTPRPASDVGDARTGVPPPLRAQVDRILVTTTTPSAPQAPTEPEVERTAPTSSQATTPQPTTGSSDSPVTRVVKSGNICRFHNRPPGRVCVRKEQCPDEHIGELQRPIQGAGSAPPTSVTEQPLSSNDAPPATSVPTPPAAAPPLARTPSLAEAPPLGVNPPPPSIPARPACRYFFRPGGCNRGAHCPFLHGTSSQSRTGSGANTPQARPPSRQTIPSIPSITAATTAAPTSTSAPPAPVSAHVRPKPPTQPTPSAPAHVSATSGPSTSTSAPAPQLVGPSRTASAPVHPLPPRPPSPTSISPESPKAQTKAKGKGKGKTGAQGISNLAKANASSSQANVKIKAEQDVSTPNTRAAKRKASGSQPKPKPKPQPTRVDTAAREIKQEEITLYDLADDSPQEPTGSSILPPEVTQSQARPGVAQAQLRPEATQPPQVQAQPRTEVAQPPPRPIAPLPSRATTQTSKAPTPPTNVSLPPLNRPPPPPYRPPQPPNPSPTTLAQGLTTGSIPALAATTAPSDATVPVTAVIPPTPVRPVPQQSPQRAQTTGTSNSLPKVLSVNTPATQTGNAAKAPTSNAPKAQAPTASKAPAPSTPTPAPTTAAANKLTVPVPRSNPFPVPPRPDRALSPQPQIQSRPRGREPVGRDNRRDSPEPARTINRRDSREAERRSLMTRIDSRKNADDGLLYHQEVDPLRPVHGIVIGGPDPDLDPGPPFADLFASALLLVPALGAVLGAQQDGYTNGSAYFPPEKNIPRVWEPETSSNRTTQNQVQQPTSSETTVIVDGPIRSSTPPPRNAMTALNDYDSFNQSRAMDISPMSSPVRGYNGGGLENRLSHHPPPSTSDYYAFMGQPLPESRENLPHSNEC